jgi:hypothetical protein
MPELKSYSWHCIQQNIALFRPFITTAIIFLRGYYNLFEADV